MTGLDIARELALLGAACCEDAAAKEPHNAHLGWACQGPRWEEMGRRMSAHLDIPDAYQESFCATLGLSPASYWLVMLCGAVEVFPDVAASMAVMGGEPRLRLATPMIFARLLRSATGINFTRALGDALGNASAERMGLVERPPLGPSARERPISQQPIRLTVGALRALLGNGLEDAIQTPSLLLQREEPAPAPGMAAPVVDAAYRILVDRGMLCIRAASARAGRQLALDLASRGGEQAFLVSATDQLPVAAELGRLRGAVPVLDLYEWCRRHPFPEPYVCEVGELLQELLVVVSQNASTFDLPTFDVGHLTWSDGTRAWSVALDGDPAAQQLARTYRVTLEEARRAVRGARDAQRVRSGMAQTTDAAAIAAEVLSQGARRMDPLVSSLSTQVQLDTLAVPAPVMLQLREIIGWYQTSAPVYDNWAMAPHDPAGKGLACWFVGAPGTGKTLAAQCVAAALRLNIYRVGLHTLKPGREADLAHLFDEAEAGHGILLFDDMDALLQPARATELTSLLQRLPEFPGVVIMIASQRATLAADALRRSHFLVEFPMPDAACRRHIWEQSLPPAEHRDSALDVEALVERLPLSGGSIYASALAAAHLAAATPSGKVTMAHAVQAVRRELEKLGLPCSRADLGPLAVYLDS